MFLGYYGRELLVEQAVGPFLLDAWGEVCETDLTCHGVTYPVIRVRHYVGTTTARTGDAWLCVWLAFSVSAG
jgi:hypothetical protein